MTTRQASTLGRLIQRLRTRQHLSTRQLGAFAHVNQSTITRLEAAQIRQPHARTLTAIAKVLGISNEQLLALTGSVTSAPKHVPLPAFTPYLRTKYHDLPPKALTEIEQYFTSIAARYGYDPDGPAGQEDEITRRF